MKESNKSYATYSLAFAISCLAGSLTYFTWQLHSISEQIPDILNQFESTGTQIEPILEKIDGITDQVHPILDEVAALREQIPAILAEVKATREQLPSALKTTENTIAAVDRVLIEVHSLVPNVLNEVKLTRQAIPPILKEVKLTRAAIPPVLNQVQLTRETVPDILNEIKLTREAVPEMMAEADILIAKAGKAGQEASSGAVTGLFTGIISTPFAIIGSIGGLASNPKAQEEKNLTDKDIEITKKTIVKTLAETKIKASNRWSNSKNHTKGVVTLIKIDNSKAQPCKVIKVEIWRYSRKKFDQALEACINEDNLWVEVNPKD